MSKASKHIRHVSFEGVVDAYERKQFERDRVWEDVRGNVYLWEIGELTATAAIQAIRETIR